MHSATSQASGDEGDAMDSRKLSKMAMVAATAVVIATQALAQTATTEVSQTNAATTESVKRVIVVSLEDRKLALVEDGQVKKVYAVAVGKPTTPSPVGTFIIERRVGNPTYSHNGKIVAPGPRNPVGTRWMGLSIHGYGIHGTNEPKSIGKAASHGCIRMAQADLEEFYPLVKVGDTVELIGQRNEETAELFGPEPIPANAPAAQPILTVASAMATAPTVQVPAQNQARESGTRETAGPVALAIAASL
jgi:lipoprotein-anchoring transpeptidase ErfK/SrfK